MKKKKKKQFCGHINMQGCPKMIECEECQFQSPKSQL